MAYLRQRVKELDIDYPLDSIWQALPKAAEEIDWDITERDEAAHRLTVKTSNTLTSYATTLKVELKSIDQNSTHLTIYGETPVTTITSTLEFGQTFDCTDDFVLALADVMNR